MDLQTVSNPVTELPLVRGLRFRWIAVSLLAVCQFLNSAFVIAAAEPASDEAAAEGQDGQTADEQTADEQPAKDPRVVWREERPIEQWRYRVLLQIAFAADQQLSPTQQQQLTDQLLRIVDRSWGLLWDVDIERNPDSLLPADVVALERLDTDALTTQFPETGYDKVMLLTVNPRAGRMRVAAREFDTRLRSLSAVQTAETTDRRLVAERAFEVLAGAFRPILVVHAVDGLDVRLRVQGGEYPAPDPNWAQVKVGDVLLAVLRYKDRKKVVQKIQQLPSTFVAVEKVERGRVEGALASALPVSLSTSGRRRVDQFCVRVRPVADTSRLQFVLRRNPQQKLVGYQVRMFRKSRVRTKTDEGPEIFLSDRRGVIELPVQPEHPVVWLYVDSGEQIVQRLPFAPGVIESATLELLDDSIRLAVEGELDLLEGQLIDTIARRAVFMALALKEAEAGKKAEVDKALAEIEKLPALREFRDDLQQIQVTGEAEADERNDRIAKSRVQRICSKLQAVLERYLAESRMREFRQTLNDKLQEAGVAP